MISRNMERQPLRTALSTGGVAASVAIVVMGKFFSDGIDYIVDAQFNVTLRSDAAVRFFNGHPSQRGAVQGLAKQADCAVSLTSTSAWPASGSATAWS